MLKRSTILSLTTLVLICVFAAGCVDEIRPSGNADMNTGTGQLVTEEVTVDTTDAGSFGEYYHLEALNVSLQAGRYELPLQTSEISNYDNFTSVVQLDDNAVAILQENGFVVVENPFNSREELVNKMYDTLEEQEIPVFITSDSLLHLYHIQFDETLRRMEEKQFYDTIWQIDSELLDKSMEDYENSSGEAKEAARRNVAYFSVALSLLEPKADQVAENDDAIWMMDGGKFPAEEAAMYSFEIPALVQDDVEAELTLIDAHEGFALSPVFSYQEDYSQYVPRGHYTYSEKLKNYFRAFMWHGRMTMLLKGNLTEAEDPELEARIQTTEAALIASHMEADTQLMEKWERIYTVTAFYVGFSDDLGPYEYMEALNSVMGDNESLETLDIDALRAELATYRSPKIYGGTGMAEADVADVEELTATLDETKGFRFMGQRFIPDSYMFQNLIYPAVDGRTMPKSLDVMALLGSERAYMHLEEQGDTGLPGYTEQYGKLQAEFGAFNASDWTKNLYWSWLYALQPLLKDYDSGYPAFMQTEAWQDKQLNTGLASWTELRHDTILYAKQFTGFTASLDDLEPEEKEVVGYVEPVPEFYNRLLALTRMTKNGLEEMDVLDSASANRLDNLEQILERLVEISEKELRNEELTEEDYAFIKSFGEELQGTLGGVEEKAQKTTIVADVGTGPEGTVLEEGVGYLDMMVVAYKVPDGRILIGAGPVMTYYEFEQPMSDRLTDEAWREMLEGETPSKPDWTDSFSP
jgi:hypothetical protein